MPKSALIEFEESLNKVIAYGLLYEANNRKVAGAVVGTAAAGALVFGLYKIYEMAIKEQRAGLERSAKASGKAAPKNISVSKAIENFFARHAGMAKKESMKYNKMALEAKKAGNTKDYIQYKLKEVYYNAKAAAGHIAKKTVEYLVKAYNYIVNLVKKAYGSVKSALKKLAEKIKELYAKLKEKAKAVANKVKSMFASTSDKAAEVKEKAKEAAKTALSA